MSGRRALPLLVWACCIALAIVIVVRARYVTDLSAFLPDKPTPTQRLLVDQLRDGPASRLILMAIEGGDATARAQASRATAAALRRDPQFSSVNNGEPINDRRDREFLFQHRYLLSDAVAAERFTSAGLHAAIADTIENLASPAGMFLKSLLPRDPTGELLHIVDGLASTPTPQTRDGVWVSPDGLRALAVVQTAANGSDSDAQERALSAMHAAFAGAAGHASLQLKLSGPAVFAVAARAKIEHAAVRLSLFSGVLVIALLLAVYRSLPALGLGLLPVASGAVIGIAAVALGFGFVHGLTLGFGVTLIGESVDYSIYFFVQSRAAHAPSAGSAAWRRQWWPTIRLGMLTSVCGFASLLPSGFPGLQQLGLYSIGGLIAAALVTRFVLPALLPANFRIHDVAPLGRALMRVLQPAARASGRGKILFAAVIAAVALITLYRHRADLWNRELAALSPVSREEQDFDARLRADLGAADVRDLVIVSGPSLESVLTAAELAVVPLQSLIDDGSIGSFESPSLYLPSTATQEARRSALPAAAQLQASLHEALSPARAAALPLSAELLRPFLEDVESTRHAALLTPGNLAGTSLGAGFDALILHQKDRWNALLPLHGAAAGQIIDIEKVRRVLAQAQLRDTRVLDLKQESDDLYAQYLREAMRFSLAGFVALTVLLLLALRSVRRAAWVLVPLGLAVLVVAAALALAGTQLTILHLVGMLLIVAVGSNYALFFDRQRHTANPEAASLTLASLAIANASTVIGFGLLSFSKVPVLVALGTTVAPGTFLALLFAALFAATVEPARAVAA